MSRLVFVGANGLFETYADDGELLVARPCPRCGKACWFGTVTKNETCVDCAPAVRKVATAGPKYPGECPCGVRAQPAEGYAGCPYHRDA